MSNGARLLPNRPQHRSGAAYIYGLVGSKNHGENPAEDCQAPTTQGEARFVNTNGGSHISHSGPAHCGQRPSADRLSGSRRRRLVAGVEGQALAEVEHRRERCADEECGYQHSNKVGEASSGRQDGPDSSDIRFNATEARGVFAETPWIPGELKEIVEGVIGCAGYPENPGDVYRPPPAS
jgi:hypothetical protein